MERTKNPVLWWGVIVLLLIVISILHFSTPTLNQQFHMIYMQSYFIPILIGALQFGVRGGLITAIAVSFIYFPHIMFQWGGMVEDNIMRFLQIALFNVIGYLTGLKAQRELEEKYRSQIMAQDLEESLTKLKQQSAKLAQLEDQLRQADRLAIVGELAASLAHEVRNPLGAIRGAVEIIQDEFPEKSKNSEFFQIIIQETERLSSVMENYLGLTRRHKHRISQMDAREIIQNTSMLLNSSAQRKGIHLEVILPNEPIILNGDPNDLQQIIMNLLLNALQAMSEPGHIEIKAEIISCKDILNPDLKIEGETQRCLQISVRDEGMGISSEALEKIFNPFYTTKPNGTGLGLAIVKRIVNENHWQIDVGSEVGVGTEFVLLIPL